MNKKGFTLVELLAVLIIIGILLTMVVLSVTSYIGKGKREYYHAMEGTLKAAAQDYVIDYKSLLPREIGNSTVITVEELVLNNYIDELIDEDKKPCTGSLSVIKKDKNEYEYNVCLQCNDNFTSSDGDCQKVESGDNNTASQYTIALNGDVTEVVDQCQPLNLPTASVYRTLNGSNTLINGNLKSAPSNVDTTILGETTVKWSYRYKSISKTVRVDDNVAPITPTVKITYLNGSEYVGRRADGSVNITNQDLIMTVNSHDYACRSIYPNLEGSGVSHILYKASNDEDWIKISTKKDTTKIPISKTVVGSIELKVVDNYDNSSDSAASFELYIDKIKPSKTTVTYLGGSNSHSWKNNYNLELSSTDDSDVAYYEVDWNNDNIADETTDNTYIPKNGFDYCNVRFRAVDIAGNRGDWSDSNHIHMDTQAPGKTTVELGGYTSGIWTNSNITQTYTASDNIGIAFYEYSSDKTQILGTTTKTWTLDNDGEYSYYVRAVDNAGNRGAWSEIYHMKRDTIKPSCTVVVTNNPTVLNGHYISPINFGFGEASDDRSQIKSAVLDKNTISTSDDGNAVIGTVTDNANNVKTCSIKVNVDLVVPKATVKNQSLVINDNDYSFADNLNITYGPLGGNVVCNPATSTIQGTYNVTCSMTGNNSKNSTVTFKVTVQTEWAFAYTGNIQKFKAPHSGTYKLEVWGAQGGNGSNDTDGTGGAGGYSAGTVTLNKNQEIYIAVGNQPTGTAAGYNGGGAASNFGGGGGGATHIAKTNTLLKNTVVSDLYLVAGAGGGSGGGATGGYGGGTTGGAGAIGGSCELRPNGVCISPGAAIKTDNNDFYTSIAGGGTQTSGGQEANGYTYLCTHHYGTVGSYGQGGSQDSNDKRQLYGGGGGGYYGGGSAAASNNCGSSGGGGSGYIGGVTDGVMKSGVESIPTHNGTSSQVGNTGNGYAKISLIRSN